MRPHVLFYDDYQSVGGHELMSVQAARALTPIAKVSFMLNEHNHRLRDLLRPTETSENVVEIVPIPYRSKRLQELRSLVSLRANRALRSRMTSLRPDLVVVAQGRIELSTLGVVAAKTAGLRVVSYLPAAHPLKVAGTRFGSSLRECVDSLHYRLPEFFITCCTASMRGIRKRHRAAQVIVVPNGIDLSLKRVVRREDARAVLGLPSDQYVVSVVGRFSFRDKGQDIIVRAFARNFERLGNVRLMLVGDGPDSSKLESQIRQTPCRDRITIRPWTNDVGNVYAASDMIAIPSRFEGFPLVLLEAMHHGLPVIGSRVDAMADVLPEEWLFESGDEQGLVDALLRARTCSAEMLSANEGRVASEYSIEQFRTNFRNAITRILDSN